MSVVYLAEDLRLKRRVALKLLAVDLAEDDAFRDRFLRESELAASIDHPNIVPIYEAGETDDLLFIAMRYVEGRDLKERLRHGRLDPARRDGHPRAGRERAGRCPRARARAPGREAVERAARHGCAPRRVRPRLPGGLRAHEAGRRRGRARRGRPPAGDDRLRRPRADRRRARSTGGRTSTRSAACSTSAWSASRRSGATPSSRSCSRTSTTEPPAASAVRPELPAALDAVIAKALAKEPERALRELPGARAGRACGRRRRGEPAARGRRLACRRRPHRPDRGRGRAGRQGDRAAARARAGAGALGHADASARVAAEGVCPFKGLASFEPGGRRVLLRPRAARRRARRAPRRRRLPRHRRAVGQRQVVGPPGRAASRRSQRGSCRAASAGGVAAPSRRAPARRPFARCSRRSAEDPLAAALDSLPEDARSCSRSTSSRSCSPPAATTTSGPPSPTSSPALLSIRGRARRGGRASAPTSTGASPPYPGLAELLGANHVLVGPMQASELRRAVELPAGRVGLRVEPELADALVDDVEGEPGALPLLSTALLELWQKRQRRHAHARRLPRVGRRPRRRRAARRGHLRPRPGRAASRSSAAIMLRLVGEGEGDAAVRRRAPLAELDLERNQDVAERACDAGRQPAGHRSARARVEVAHEALLREWPRLREWIDEDAAGRPAAPAPDRRRDGMGRGRTRPGRALPRRPPRRRARLEQPTTRSS